VGAPELVVDRIVGARGGERLRLAYRVPVAVAGPRDEYDVVVDAAAARPIARRSRLRFAAEEVVFDAPIRGPAGDRMSYPAPLEAVQVDGADATTDASGVVSWSAPATTLTTFASGTDVEVVNQGGAPASGAFALSDGGQALWSLASDEFGDAQLTSFVHASRVQARSRGIAPDMTWLDGPLPVKPNEDDPVGCNAYWDGTGLNFYRQNASCNNTARIADVIYHEFGHGFHQHAVIPGAGALDQALGEGTGDYMAVTTTGDPNLAPGFFLASPTAPLRVIDSGRRWPDDISQDPHETGLIWAGAMWDARSYLSDELGPEAGVALADELYYQAIRRAPNIPATYVEVLAADDDDGDLGNGTPHVCVINRAFAKHGLSDGLDATGLTITHHPLDVVPGGGAPYAIEVDTERPYPDCPHAASVESVSAVVTLSGQTPTTVPLARHGTSYVGAIPPVLAGSGFRYHVEVTAGGVSIALPDDRADPDYYVFAGKTVPLYCNDFEHDIDGWTLSDGGIGVGDFQWGEPQGNGGDPAAAYSGKKVLGTRFDGDGTYRPGQASFAKAPTVDLKGYTHVRLQLRRWLTVEDGFYDHATITANGAVVWQNLGTNESDGTLDLVDREWRFFDVDLSGVVSGTADVAIGLQADAQKSLGGWNVDDFCIVGVEDAPPSTGAGGGGGSGGAGPKDAPAGAGCACRASPSPEHTPWALAAA
ncbi:MAG TPA: hypothetical protein VHB21_28635, partial [Minicystis sp.]|nr:hypothetical protein [Minicystis sp.]